jgi:hypothetical protein
VTARFVVKWKVIQGLRENPMKGKHTTEGELCDAALAPSERRH